MSEFSHFLSPVLVFVLIVVFGFWLRIKGKPYNGVLFNLHKLLALGNVIITGMTINRLIAGNDIPALLSIFLALAGITVIALFATGTLMSINKLDYGLVRTVHRVSVIALVLVLVLFVNQLMHMAK